MLDFNNEKLRYDIKELKIHYDVNYKNIAEQLGIAKNSFYNWIKGYYNLSTNKQIELQKIINKYKGV